MNKRFLFFVLFFVITFSVFSFEIVAHRGASFDAPENTLASFKLAWLYGADAVEGDFYLTNDNKIVCIHDKTTKRTSNVDVVVGEESYDYLKYFDFSYNKKRKFGFQKIPLISEVFDTVPSGKKIVIEIKSDKKIVPFLKEEIEKSGLENSQIRIISFDKEVIRECKKSMPDIKAVFLVHLKNRDAESLIKVLEDIGADGINTDVKVFVNGDWIKKFSFKGFEYHIYTVDDYCQMHRLHRAGVHSITTNKVYVARRYIENIRN